MEDCAGLIVTTVALVISISDVRPPKLRCFRLRWPPSAASLSADDGRGGAADTR